MKARAFRWTLLPLIAAAAFLSAPGTASADARDAFPRHVIYADDYPVHVSFFFEGGTPVERMTGRRERWYGIYEAQLRPGFYRLVLKHNGDPSRMRLSVLEHDPYDRFNTRAELPLDRVSFHDNSQRAYQVFQSHVGISGDFKRTRVHFIVEWTPVPGRSEPIQASFQVITLYNTDEKPRPSTSFFSDKWSVQSPLESTMMRRGPIVLPPQPR